MTDEIAEVPVYHMMYCVYTCAFIQNDITLAVICHEGSKSNYKLRSTALRHVHMTEI